MSKKSKIKFIFGPLSEGKNSRLKLVLYDRDDKVTKVIYSFDGQVKNNNPQLWEDAEKIEKFSFWNEQNGMKWLLEKWQQVSIDPSVVRGFISDSDYPNTGTVRQLLTKNTATPRASASFIYQLKVKTATTYEMFSTSGIIDTDTGEVFDDWKSCLRDLQGRYTNWQSRNPDIAKSCTMGLVIGDGKTHYQNPRLAPWLIDFNPQTAQFMRKGRREILKIHDEATMKQAQNFEEYISNILA